MIYASAASRSTRRDGRMRKPPPAILGDYLFGGTALKQAREHTTSASITSVKEKDYLCLASEQPCILAR